MTQTADALPQPPPPILEGPWTAARAGAWRKARIVSFLCLVPLGWLLVALIWLPLYMGLFFFLVAGLLVGAVSFRLARAARPMERRRILRGACVVALACTAINLVWEYDQFARAAGKPPRFAEARNAVVAAGEKASSIDKMANVAFRAALTERYAPGGPIGYVRWAVSGADLPVSVNGQTESIVMPHGGFRWPIRTLAALLLLAVGLYLSFEALTSSEPVSNILPPGAEYTEE
ncbi:MAG: hypothetical protein HBSAPP02_24180 [Phycisphaerae bacterium]|nr:MAG: hypothetical protein HRU71_14400 [Planctomycetia bacterium]GJQ27386.1 MAG: hypothetical protein HBSAPP02_24180 [Phycisphaerae bacterium]